ncbi:hypothetical protein M0R45_010705 [Rubus argutus]|uniref:Uncharacterized protein n=1 Tax=Rubus argutus TaxID=59490 RepID=A0AAW1Y8N5_RUBAR
MAGPSRTDVCYPPGSDDFSDLGYKRRLVLVDPDLDFPLGPQSPRHYNPRCPYWDIVPQGATVGPGYQVAAARIKFARERLRQAGALVPVKPHYVPAPPPGFVNMEEAKNT